MRGRAGAAEAVVGAPPVIVGMRPCSSLQWSIVVAMPGIVIGDSPILKSWTHWRRWIVIVRVSIWHFFHRPLRRGFGRLRPMPVVVATHGYSVSAMDTITTPTGAIPVMFGWCVADSDFSFLFFYRDQ